MRKAILILATVVFLSGASAAFADGGTIDYTATSTIASFDQPFTITFSEPGTLTSLDTFTTATLTLAGTTEVFTGAEVVFFPSSDAGLFDVNLLIGGDPFDFSFGGSQSYSGHGPFTLLTGKFPVAIGAIFEGNQFVSGMEGGSVKAVAAPEPLTLTMLGLGLAGIGVLRKKNLLA